MPLHASVSFHYFQILVDLKYRSETKGKMPEEKRETTVRKLIDQHCGVLKSADPHFFNWKVKRGLFQKDLIS